MAYDLARFKDAQTWDYPQALAEIRAGRKVTHWIWYVFPQLRGLGRSDMADFYGIEGMGEAQAYLADEELRANLVEISQALLGLDTNDPDAVMGCIDAIKLRSSMTLFSHTPGTDPVFEAVLRTYYGGSPDLRTLEMLGREGTRLDRIRGCLVGGAVGDALGYAIEFYGESEIFGRYGRPGITSYELDFATNHALISDDTQMTLFTATGILYGQTREVLRGTAAQPRHYVALAYQDWLRTQELSWEEAKALMREGGEPKASWLADVPELYSRRAPGTTCLTALRRRREEGGVARDYLAARLNNSKGCGGVMRAAPVGLAWPGADIEETDLEAAQVAAISHGSPLGFMPASVLAHIVSRLALCDGRMTLKEAVTEALEAVARIFEGDICLERLCALVNLAVELSENDAEDLDNIHRLGEGWVGEEALAIAVYCALRHQTDFSAGVIAAVNHKGDSDSTGSVTGNILGALLGYGAIDHKWKGDLELHDVIMEVADDLFCGCRTNGPDNQLDPAWERKYVRRRR